MRKIRQHDPGTHGVIQRMQQLGAPPMHPADWHQPGDRLVTPTAGQPTESRVRQAMQQMLDTSAQTGHRPSVLALARQFGMSNTTFRRHYPDIAREIAHARSVPPDTPNSNTAATYETLVARNAKLRRTNHQLTEQLKLAAAQIQRLAVDNARLRQALEDEANVTHLRQRSRRTTPDGS